MAVSEDWGTAVFCPSETGCRGTLSADTDLVTWDRTHLQDKMTQRWIPIVLVPFILRHGQEQGATEFRTLICQCHVSWGLNQHSRVRVEADFPVNSVVLNSIVKACASAKRWEVAVFLLHNAKQFAVEADVLTYTASISSFAVALAMGQTWEVACALLHSMPQSSIQADTVCLNAALKACECSSVWDLGLALLAAFQLRSPSVVTFNTAISACAKGREWQQDMVLAQVAADAASFNAAIASAEKTWQISLELWQEMQNTQLQRDVREAQMYNASVEP
eukprot:s105_g30.t1